ncbi:sugar MFS transporter [uncultured Sphingomonas sp.]|mgnify:CR=1 FL=1|uniref:sugar MFS transporter n=1 Tax=uncultured Sphingomonas sp. TaxID=158754 RepID=UPI0025D94036|nr:sugar MFS transporter [uncultured Sphingomonas sp.]
MASSAPRQGLAFAYVTTLFFIWGAVTSVNDILIPAVKSIFTLSDTEAFLTQFAFFMAYGIVSLPAAAFVARRGAANAIVTALAIMVLGCLIVPVATTFRAYPLVLLALFVIAAGITLLQVSANPLSAVLGPPQGAHFRLVLSQAFNSLGTVVGPYLAARTLLSGGLFEGGAPTEAKVAESLGKIDIAYAFVAMVIVALALFIWTARHRLTAAAPRAEVASHISEAFRSKWAVLGALAIFTYVGAEVSIGSALVNFLEQPNVLGMSAEAAGKCVSVYWLCAMIGRFAGSALLRVVRADRLLVTCAGVAVILCLSILSPAVGTILSPVLSLIAAVLAPLVRWWAQEPIASSGIGPVIGLTAISIGLFNSIMFPVIFTLTIQRSTAAASATSGLLCMAIVGGALVPLLFAQVADASGSRFVAFIVPMLCYAFVAAFALVAGRARIVSDDAAPIGAH